jgi:YidC/Oxa1 family membrane protein insertase
MASRSGKFHLVDPAQHHPIVGVLQHVISPLTASLFIWAVHKLGQGRSAGALLRALLLLRRSGQLRIWPLRIWPRPAANVPGTAAYRAYSPGPPPFKALSLGAAAGAGSEAAAVGEVPAGAHERLLTHLDALYSPADVPFISHHLTHELPPVQALEAVLYAVHDASGLPWWGTILSVTLILRLALAPVNILLLRNSLRMKVIQPQVDDLDAVLRTGTREQQLEAAHALRALFVASGCSPWAQTVVFPLLLPPAILAIFKAVHNLAMGEPGMATGGNLWFIDLVAQDSTHILPIVSALTWLWNVEMGAGVFYGASPSLKLAARMSSVATIPLSATLPSGVFIFWITSNLFAVARGYAMRPDAVRRLLKMPLASEIKKLSHLPAPVVM